MKYIVLSLAIISLLTACGDLERTVELDIGQTEKRVVIEGFVGNQPGMQYAVVSYNVDFYTDGKTPRISNALVMVSDEAGNSWELAETDTPGRYEADFLPETGKRYTMEVTVDGQTYTASERLNPITNIDSLTWEIDENEQEDPDDEGYFYNMLVYVTEPQETKDFYLFKFYRNDSIQNFDNTWSYVASDEFVQENINGIRGPVFFSAGDTAKIEAYSISEEAYVFYNDLNQVLNNDGGLFGPIPANLRNNWSNGALGYFQVSSMTDMSIVIGEENPE